MKGRKSLTIINLNLLYHCLPSYFSAFHPASTAATKADLPKFQRSIVDYRRQLNPRFKKIKQAKTRYIGVHTSELGLNSTLRVISKENGCPPVAEPAADILTTLLPGIAALTGCWIGDIKPITPDEACSGTGNKYQKDLHRN